MLNLTQAVRQLKNEREQAQRRLERLDTALQALSGVGSLSGLNRGRVRNHTTSGKGRAISVAARKRIAAAQRKRWAKWRAAQEKRQ